MNTQMRVLVLDDDLWEIDLMRDLLKELGAPLDNVVFADPTNIMAARRICDENSDCDVVISDGNYSNERLLCEDGLALLIEQRAKGKQVFCTTRESTSQKKCQEAGVEWVAKGDVPKKILALISMSAPQEVSPRAQKEDDDWRTAGCHE